MKTFLNTKDIEEAKSRISSIKNTDKAQFGEFTVDKMICHLIDSLSISYGEKGEKKAKKVFIPQLLVNGS